jgi:hypothetical protein
VTFIEVLAVILLVLAAIWVVLSKVALYVIEAAVVVTSHEFRGRYVFAHDRAPLVFGLIFRAIFWAAVLGVIGWAIVQIAMPG